MPARLVGKVVTPVGVGTGIWVHTISVNLRGHLLYTRAAVPALPGGGGGSRVSTSPDASRSGEPERPYCAISKSGLNAPVRPVAIRWLNGQMPYVNGGALYR